MVNRMPKPALYIVPTLRVGMHSATLLRRVLVGITNKPEVIAVYDLWNGITTMDMPCFETRVAGCIPMRSVGMMKNS
ncbi:hypothetical protein CCP3SC1_650017 [Gammaproteobacteria bacterium]